MLARARLLAIGLATVLLVDINAVSAQPPTTADHQKSDDFVRTLQKLFSSHDPDEKIALANAALKQETQLRQWQLRADRETVRGQIWLALGVGHADRRTGDSGDNAEKAIGAYVESLRFLKPDRAPRDWASAQNNLGNSYSSRARGSRSDNLESALAAYQAALTVAKRELWPDDWAQSLHHMGLTYVARIGGDRADNLEKAIVAFEAALEVRTRSASPLDWASTQHSLGTAFTYRVRGARAENLEKAIAAYEAALTVRTRQRNARHWASTLGNMGLAYINRIWGDSEENLRKAITALEAVLPVYSREAEPNEWAGTQHNLGFAYSNRMSGDRADNLEKAIAALEAALTVRTRDAAPEQWATTHNTLALGYLFRVHGDRSDNIERALTSLKAALAVRTRKALPREWAQTQSNLGLAYFERKIGARSDNLKNAVAAFEAALDERTRDAAPRDHLRTSRLLASVHVERQDWGKVRTVIGSAREAFLLLFGEGLDEVNARDLLEHAGPMFADAAYAAAAQNEPAAAFELLGEGKARLLAVSLRLQAHVAPTQQQRAQELRSAIRNASATAEAATGEARADVLRQLAALRGELVNILVGASRPSKSLADGASLVPAGGAILAPVVTDAGSKILIFSATSDGKPISVLDLPDVTRERINTLIRGDGKVGASGGWLGGFNVQYLPAEELNARIGEWTGTIESIGADLWSLFVHRLDAALQERGIRPGARLVWLPTGALGLLPLGLAHAPASGLRLGEKYELVTAPSLEALAEATRHVTQSQTPTLAIVVNPTGDLPFTEVESALVAAYFTASPRALLDKSSATPRAVLAGLKDKSYWHFSSHGRFDWHNARDAGLIMKDAETLTIGTLLDAEGSLGRPRLVVLSACETGIYDTVRNADEFVGLPATFMQLGAAGVLGTLWQVDDFATSLLMAKFYDLHLGEGLSPPTALARSQTWLRDATKEQVIAFARLSASKAKLDPGKLADLENALSTVRRAGRFGAAWNRLHSQSDAGSSQNPVPHTAADSSLTSRPFNHPYYWGGFIYTGL